MAGKTPKTKRKSPLAKYLQLAITLIVIGGVGFLAYSGYKFQTSEQEEEGFFVCNTEGTECELSQHIHADIEVNVCGENVEFGREKGRTDEMHTHKEKNYMHWHARLKVDPETREPTGTQKDRTTLQAFLTQMEFEFPDSCPNNSEPTLSVFVNEEPNTQGLNYTWVDGDDVVIDYN
jgi:hypothetical protein